MELRELGDRLFRLHAKLIIAIFLACVLGGLALHLRSEAKYQANAEFVMGTADPQSAQDAAALADTARAIATGPQLVAGAISQMGVARDANTVAAGINVKTLGSSGVLTLSVTDPDPQVAVKLANALAASVVDTRVALTRNGLASSLRALSQQQASTQTQIRQLESQIKAQAALLRTTPVTAQAPALAQLSALEARLTSLQDQVTQIALQRNQLAAQQGPAATVLDKATSAAPDSGNGLVDPVLGAILGLVAGTAAAAVRETARPTVVGAAAISRAVGTPLLGEMSKAPESWNLANLPDAGSYIELAADSQQANEVRFAVLDPNGRRPARVRMLEGPLHLQRLSGAVRDSRSPKLVPVSADLPPQPAATVPEGGTNGENSLRTGLVMAIPRTLKVADIDAVTNFIWISGWTLLGVVVFSAKRSAARTSRRTRTADVSHDDPIARHLEVR